MQTKKIDDSTMEVTQDAVPVEQITTTYSIDFLKNQELTILKSMNDFVAARQVELDNVKNLIAEATKLGLKTSEEIQADQVSLESSKLESSQAEIIK